MLETYEGTFWSVLHLDLRENNFSEVGETDSCSQSRMGNCLLWLDAKLSCNNQRYPKAAHRSSICTQLEITRSFQISYLHSVCFKTKTS